MHHGKDPVSAFQLSWLGGALALGAVAATIGLVLSEPGDDAARIAYLASLVAATLTAVAMIGLEQGRRRSLSQLRVDAAALSFDLRQLAARFTTSNGGSLAGLDEALREATSRARVARGLLTRLIALGSDREAGELRIAIDALEVSLGPQANGIEREEQG